MLEIFRKNYFITSVLLLPYLYLLRIGLFMHDRTLNFSNESLLSKTFIYPWINSSVVEIIITNTLIFIQAVIINYMFLNHKLSRNASLLAGLFYIVLMSLIYTNTFLSDVLIANTFLIIAIRNILRSYKQNAPTFRIFNIGFNLGLASLLFYPYYLLIIFAIIGLLIIRSFKLLEVLQLLVSFFIPMFLYFTYNYWMEIPFNPFGFVGNIEFQLPTWSFTGFNLYHLGLIIFVIFTFLSLFWYSDFVGKKSMEIQKKINILYWFGVFIVLCFALFTKFESDYLIALAIPLSIFLGIKASDSRSKVAFEILHLLLLIVVVLSQFNLIQLQ